MRIRRITKNDIIMLSDFFASLSDKTLYFFTPHSLEKDFLQEMIENIDEDNDSIRFMSYTGEGKNETMTGYIFCFNWKRKVPTLGIGVRDDFQGVGLGKNLLEHMIKVALESQKGAVLLTTKQDNIRAQALYKKFGFEIIGVDKRGEFILLLNFEDDSIY
jgi:ribosomal protein S18 acetylase RimI-like enzyme